jgi:hydroxymethylglutaryl-CoA synthase
MGMSVESVGSYLPRYRITAAEIGDAWDGFRARGVTEKRVAGTDEDSVTIAVAALKDAITTSGYDREEFGTLAVATTTPPIDEGDIGVTIAEILGLAGELEVVVHTQSTRAGTRAVLSAHRAEGPALAAAADCPIGDPGDAVEHAAGAGAVALVLDREDEGVSLSESATYTQEFPGTRFRRRGSETVETYDATAYEREAYTTAIGGAVDGLENPPAALAPTASDGSLPTRAAGAVEEGTVYHLADRLGDTGAASPLFGLVAAWEAGEQRVAMVGYGDGAGADALVFEGTHLVGWERPAEDVSYAEYLRKRGHVIAEGGEH